MQEIGIPEKKLVKLTILKLKKKINLWLTAPKRATPVNYTSATDWQMAARRDNVICITLRQV